MATVKITGPMVDASFRRRSDPRVVFTGADQREPKQRSSDLDENGNHYVDIHLGRKTLITVALVVLQSLLTLVLDQINLILQHT